MRSISGIYRKHFEAGSFRQANHKVHILDGLPGGAFHQVVKAANNDELSRLVVNGGVNKTEVISPGMLGVRRCLDYPNEGLILIKVQVKLKYLVPSLLVPSNLARRQGCIAGR